MAIDLIFYINLLCSVAGIFFFAYSLLIVNKIKGIFPSGKVLKKWSFIQVMIGIFLTGYGVNIVFNFIGDLQVILFMTAIVYIFGGLFVFMIINLSYKTYRLIVVESAPKVSKVSKE